MSSVDRESLFSMGEQSKKQDGWSAVIRETKKTQQEGRKAKKLESGKKKTKVGK